MEKETEQLKRRVEELEKFVMSLTSSTTIPFEIDNAFRKRLSNMIIDVPSELSAAPLTAITAPTGGLTEDSQARTAINTIITRLETLGLLIPN